MLRKQIFVAIGMMAAVVTLLPRAVLAGGTQTSRGTAIFDARGDVGALAAAVVDSASLIKISRQKLTRMQSRCAA
jgi:hypothetical protein